MDILFTCPTYDPHRGGAESSIQNLASEFVRQGHRVTIVTSRFSPSLAARERQNGSDIVRLDYPPQTIRNLNQVLLLLPRCLRLLLELHRIIKNRRIDTVCIGLVGIDSFFVLLLTYVMRFKLIVHIRGGELRSYIRISRFMNWTLRHCLRRCQAAIAVSQKLREEAIQFAPVVRNKIFVIPGGVDINRVRSQPKYDYPREYILYVGRLHPVKDVATLINAYQRVAEQIPEVDLLIVGTGPEENRLKNLVSACGLNHRILFLGDGEKEQVFSFINGCEFLILPSQAEGCPVTVLEAMAAGKMTIGSRVKGISELIEHEKNGILFPAGDAAELSRLMLKFHSDQTERRRIEENLQHADGETYDIRRLSQAHLQLYRGFKPRLNVCLISAFYYQDETCSGLASYYYNLATALAGAGHNLFLITLADHGRAPAVSPLTVVTIQQKDFAHPGDATIGLRSLKRLFARWMFAWKAYGKARELNRSGGLDIVVAPELFAQGFFISLFMGRKLLTRIHAPTYVVDRYNELYRHRGISTMLSWPEKIQARLSRRVTLASASLAATIARDWGLPPDKISMIPNGIQIEWVRQAAARQERMVEPEYLLYFGRLERGKGVHIISHALREVFARRPEMFMVFVGKDCGLKQEIVRENAEYTPRILFFDTMGREKLFGMIRYARLILLPSLFENVSNAGLEAMALGKPVIGTSGTGFEELIRDQENGFLVPPGDPQALSAKIIACLARNDLERIGQRAYESVLPLDMSTVVAAHVELYREILSTR